MLVLVLCWVLGLGAATLTPLPTAPLSSEPLARWLPASVTLPQFRSQYYEQRPLWTRHAAGFANVLSLGQLDGIIGSNPDAMVSRRGARIVREGQSPNVSGAITPDDAHQAYGIGATLVINQMERLAPSVRALAAELESFGLFVSANLYLTPGGARGFDPHWDPECSFIVQLEGKKTWHVFTAPKPNTLLPLPDDKANLGTSWRAASDSAPAETVVLEAGDVLYVPRGMPHYAETTKGANSMHLTMSLHSQLFTWHAILQLAISKQPELSVSIQHVRMARPPKLKAALGRKYSSKKGCTFEAMLLESLRVAADAHPELKRTVAPQWPEFTAATFGGYVGLWLSHLSEEGSAKKAATGAGCTRRKKLDAELVALAAQLAADGGGQFGVISKYVIGAVSEGKLSAKGERFGRPKKTHRMEEL